ncbi:uncharacterized protein [Hetaerina americana]|uniref:uncharacterized protein n=1 Tax=Hetaerina americana TaxID=62018 RepID=UPI003A7F39F9
MSKTGVWSEAVEPPTLGQRMSRLGTAVARVEGQVGADAEGHRAKRGLGGVGRGAPPGLVSREPDEGGGAPPSTPRPHHALRHRHRQHSRHRVDASPPPPDDGDAGARGQWVPLGSASTSPASAPGPPLASSPRDGHAACYGPDQVVLIIALTCALNFACIFLVMAFVHICNRNRKCASTGCDSPLLFADDSDCEADLKAALSSSPDESDHFEEDALLLAKRPFPPWRPCATLLGAERRRCGPLASSSSSGALGGGAAHAANLLLPPAAFSMEDLHILE